MKIVDFLQPELHRRPTLQATTKPAVLAELADHLGQASVPGVEAEALRRVLVEREQLASTAIGEGVAIPHGKLDAVGKLVGALGRARRRRRLRLDGRPADPPVLRAGGARELDRRAPEGAGAHLPPVQGSRVPQAPPAAPSAEAMYQVIADEDAKY